ncbi:hypothetical protein GSM30_05935 [Clostridioides difficile]|nr:hypothetical protein [Clostridioides difficile]
MKQATVCVRYRGKKLEDQRQALLLLTAFSIGNSLKNGCPFPLCERS